MKSVKRVLKDILGTTGREIVSREALRDRSARHRRSLKVQGFYERLLNEFIFKDPERIDLKGFSGHCLENLGRSHSQWQQDLWVMYETGGMSEGFFVEFGASDGIAGSNTLMLEKDRGWKGVLCEPVPSEFAKLQDNRRNSVCVNAAVSVDDQRQYAFSVVPGQIQLSTISALKFSDIHAEKREASTEITVPAIDINDLIERGGPDDNVVDYLSIDTEGGELEILKRTDFDRWRIRSVTVEHNFRQPEMKEIPDLMAARNFDRIDLAYVPGCEYWFRNKDFRP